MRIQKNGTLSVLAASAFFVVCGMLAPAAGAQSKVAEGEKSAKEALDAGKLSAFDGSMKFVEKDVVQSPVASAEKEVKYVIDGPGAGVKSSVEYRVYETPAAAAAHADPNRAQQMQEASEYELPRGSFKAYHSNLTGSELAKAVPETFHCMAQSGKAWSRCYYYAGGGSNIVVVGTTTSSAPNEAILLTAMGAQALGQ